MVTLVPSMLRTRRTQAIAVFLLSAVATAAAVAGPVAANSVGAAVVRGELARAAALDTSVAVSQDIDPSQPLSAQQFAAETAPMVLPGFVRVSGGEFLDFPLHAPGVAPSVAGNTRTVFRDGACAHIVISSGRCFAGTYEVVVDETTATTSGLRLGTSVIAQAMTYDQHGQPIPGGPPTPVTVVGIYHPRDPNERYWGSHNYFPATASGERAGPILVDPATFDLITHANAESDLDMFASVSAFGSTRLVGTSDEVTAVLAATDTSNGLMVSTSIPDLVSRIEVGQARAHELVSVAFLPVVGLCWFVVYLTVAYGLAGRRNEIGLINLRGLGRARRVWMATGETLTMIVAGAPVGYLLGYAVVGLFAAARLGSTAGTELRTSTLPYALVALAAALIVAVGGQWSVLRADVLELLRGVPGRTAVWRAMTVELLLVALAIVGVVELRGGGDQLVGVGMVVPGLVVATVAVLAARLFTLLADGFARTALRRGRLGFGLAAIQIARRPGSQRLFALLTAAVGLLAFVATATSVASIARNQRAAVVLGAPSVVTIERPSGPALLAAVRAVDPAGTWAMAVLPVNQQDSEAPPVLAVDAARLPAVTDWDDTRVSAASVAAALAPRRQVPMVLRDTAFTVDVQVSSDGPGKATAVLFTFVSLRGGAIVRASIEVPAGPRATYPADVPQCADGCRLTGFTVDGTPDTRITVSLYGLRTSSADLVGAADLASVSRWHSRTGAILTSTDGSLRIESRPSQYAPLAVTVVALAAPLPLPVVSTQPGVQTVTGLDGESIDTVSAAVHPGLLPQLGTTGTLVDLGYLVDVGAAVPATGDGEVWLGPRAPAQAVARLRAAGLAVKSVRTIGDVRADLAATGPALGLQFYLAAAVLGMLLGLGGLALVVTVDRRRRADDLRALRNQGLPRRFAYRASLWGYLSLVLGSAVAGLVAAAVTWYFTGQSLPVFIEQLADVPPVRWPHPAAVLVPWTAATAILAVGAAIAGWTLRRAINTTARRDVTAHGGIAGAPVRRTQAVVREGDHTMGGLAVNCRRVVQIYRGEAGDVVALAGVDLIIAPGEMLALVGPSGSGKSTLIALLSGLMRPSAGRISIGSYDIGKLSDTEISRLRGTEIGVVLQGAARNLLPYATLAKNIKVAQTRAARTRGIKLDHPERILDLVGLGGYGHLHLTDLTAGAQQRAALAVGIATGPGLLLVDEPTSQLDTHGRDEVISAMEMVNAERGTTIVVVTHDAEVGNRLSRAVTIRDGRVGAEGRGGQDFAVVASDGTVQLPPEVLGEFPPGTLFTVDRTESTVSFAINGEQRRD